ncbi:MAG: adenosylcobinamide-phosphate synthase CbiB, partial [Hyphomicrobiales bacterium]
MLLDYTLFLSGTLASLLVALLLDAILGDPDWIWRRLPHPVVWIGKLVGLFDRVLNLKRNNALNFLLGLFVTLLLVVLGISGGIGLRWVSEQSLYGAAAAILFVAILLAQKSLYSHVKRVADALKDPNIETARQTVAMIVGRDPQQLNKSGISRATIESCAENLSDGVVAPAFWFAVAGFPGLVVYKAINTADSMIGHKNERYHAFGWSAARLDD